MTRRVVITGIGVRAPGGRGTKEFWSLLSEGRTATRAISFFDASPFRSRIAGEVDFDAEAEGLSPREIRRMDRATQFAVVCARDAVADSGLETDRLDPHRIGVSLGSAVASATSLENEYLVLSDAGRQWEVDPGYLSPHMFDYLSPGVMPAEVAWSVGAEGPVTMVSDGCTSGLDAVGYGVQLIREGAVDTVVAGAADTPVSPIVVACFDAIKATSPRNDDPAHASRPFDGSRNGFVLAEGAAMFVLEEYEAAKRRGAHIYAEVGGYATRCNAYHMTGLKKDGREMAEAIRVALDEARLDRTVIDYVNAHGSGTKQNDRHETAAFKRSLGRHAYDVPVSSIKSMVGHSLGAIGSVEIAASALAIEHNVIPPTANLHTPDPERDLDYVPSPRASSAWTPCFPSAAASVASRAPWCCTVRRWPGDDHRTHGPTRRRHRHGRAHTRRPGPRRALACHARRAVGARAPDRLRHLGPLRAHRRPDPRLRRRPTPAQQAAPTDRRLHPLRPRRGRAGAQGRRRRPGHPARLRDGRHHRQRPGRLRLHPPGVPQTLVPGARVRLRVRVLRLVLRGELRPDIHPARHARPQRGARRRAGGRSRRPRPRPADRHPGHPPRAHRRRGLGVRPLGLDLAALLRRGLPGRRPGPRLSALRQRGVRLHPRGGRGPARPGGSRVRRRARRATPAGGAVARGIGLESLTARLARVCGRLTAAVDREGWFRLDVVCPVPDGTSADGGPTGEAGGSDGRIGGETVRSITWSRAASPPHGRFVQRPVDCGR